MIESWETEIRCEWTFSNGRVESSEACDRIRRLTDDDLVVVAHDSSGWDTLSIDQVDGRFWEHTFPRSEMHGGGPALLRVITLEEARVKYPEAATRSAG